MPASDRFLPQRPCHGDQRGDDERGRESFGHSGIVIHSAVVGYDKRVFGQANHTTTPAVLAVLYDSVADSAIRFPLPVLDRLGSVLGAQTTGYGVLDRDCGRRYSTVYLSGIAPRAGMVAETVARLWTRSDHVSCHARAVEPMAIPTSEHAAFHRLEFFRMSIARSATADSVRSSCRRQMRVAVLLLARNTGA